MALEQPLPPNFPTGEIASTPIGLGRIGDIEFWAPNRGLLITAGNPPTIPAGIWAYNGVGWHSSPGLRRDRRTDRVVGPGRVLDRLGRASRAARP